jgi:uracil-DNA glycosylase
MKRNVSQKQRALDTIAKEIAVCKVCQKGKVGKPVPGEGNPDADIVFLGEAPGKTEAATGRPFVGRAGKLLRQLIADVGLSETDVYITSPVKYLPTYVTPTLADIQHGKIHLDKQLAIIQPKIIVLMGSTAVQAMLGEKLPIAQVHGKTIKNDNRIYFITYHPAAPLYSPKVKTELIKDFKQLKKLV